MLIVNGNYRDISLSFFIVALLWALATAYELYEGRQVGELREIVGISERHAVRRGAEVPFIGGSYSGRCEIPPCRYNHKWARVTHTTAVAQVDEAGKIMGLRVGGIDMLTAEDVADWRRHLWLRLLGLLVLAGTALMFFRRFNQAKRNSELGTVQGSLTSVETVFDEEPGYLYFQTWESERADQTRIEHFYVTVRLHSGITGDIEPRLPAAMSVIQLENYSPELFERLVKGYFGFNEPLRGIALDREAKLAFLRALAPLPQMATCHRIVAKNGRLMLQMSRLFQGDDGHFRQPKEVVLERSRIALESLAADWAKLVLRGAVSQEAPATDKAT